jgi:signal transduction histidine kinase
MDQQFIKTVALSLRRIAIRQPTGTFEFMAVTHGGAAREDWHKSLSQPHVAAYESSLPREPTPSNDVGTDADRAAFRRILEGGLHEALKSNLRGQVSRAVAMARVLVDQVNGAHSPAVQSILEAVEHTESMLEDVLEFLHAGRNGRVQVTRRRTNLKPVCERIIDSIQSRHPTHGLEFASDPRVDGDYDPDAIAAMLSRLIMNGIEHGPGDGLVRITLHGLANQVVLEVWNAGAMPADVPMDRLFEPFACVRARRSDARQGLGLGLCLSSAIARAHDGYIEAQSDPARGTTFRVVLPKP